MKHISTFVFFLFLTFFALSQDNNGISNALEITCDISIESTTIGYSSDQEQLTEWGLNDCGTSVDSSPGVWYYLEGNDTDIVLRMCDSSYDTKLHIFQDSVVRLPNHGKRDCRVRMCTLIGMQHQR